MDKAFKHKIGDRVMNTALLHVMVAEMAQGVSTPRMMNLRVLERHSVECIGGTQLFYLCETTEGQRCQMAEDSLMQSEQGFTVWIEAFEKQYHRLHPKKDQPL